ncbi:MAG: N-acetyltransferase family protein [Acidimicrobiia bacterium]
MSEISVRRATPSDRRRVAEIHAAAFPDYFLTHLGPSFLQRYYEAFLREPHTVVIGSVDGRPAGFVAGTTDLARFRRDLYTPNLLRFPAIVAGKIVVDPVVRRHVFARLHHVRLAVSSLLHRGDRSAPEQGAETTSYLFSICVDPATQGTGMADAVMAGYIEAERTRGARRIRLSVFDDNARAIRFYERGGWKVSDREGNSVLYELELND